VRCAQVHAEEENMAGNAELQAGRFAQVINLPMCLQCVLVAHFVW
jgi:hypothetical protein